MGENDEVCGRFASGSRIGDRRCFDIVVGHGVEPQALQV